MKTSIGDTKVSLKSKLEYRDVQGNDRWRLREKLKVKQPVNLGTAHFAIFVSDELFYDFDPEDWNQNRAAAGLSLEPFSNVELDLFYLNRADKDENEWSSVNVIGTEIVVAF